MNTVDTPKPEHSEQVDREKKIEEILSKISSNLERLKSMKDIPDSDLKTGMVQNIVDDVKKMVGSELYSRLQSRHWELENMRSSRNSGDMESPPSFLKAMSLVGEINKMETLVTPNRNNHPVKLLLQGNWLFVDPKTRSHEFGEHQQQVFNLLSPKTVEKLKDIQAKCITYENSIGRTPEYFSMDDQIDDTYSELRKKLPLDIGLSAYFTPRMEVKVDELIQKYSDALEHGETIKILQELKQLFPKYQEYVSFSKKTDPLVKDFRNELMKSIDVQGIHDEYEDEVYRRYGKMLDENNRGTLQQAA